MTTPSDGFHELMDSLGPAEDAEIERIIAERSSTYRDSDLRDDPDPFGRDWDWLEEPEGRRDSVPPSDTIPLTGRRRRPRRLLWASGIAASLALVTLGSWAAYRWSRPGPLRERDIAAWVTRRLEAGEGGVRIAAPAGDNEEAEEPLLNRVDRPRDAVPPSSPNVYAPLRVQEQLVITEVPTDLDPTRAFRRPLKTVVETIRPGATFYLEFTTASLATPGSAVAVRATADSWRLMRDEIAVSPAEGTCYFGPLKMGEDQSAYLLIVADRVDSPLISTVQSTLPDGSVSTRDPEAWRSRLEAAMKRAGHSWYAIQRIEVRPDVVKSKSR